ncbi:MAG: ABC transporter ATP-binding protein [Clostridia bacterium]|nr:ABC transporter ATP-binding protein [Clostridia bacterium]
MIFGKHINKYYLKYLPILLFGVASLIMVDYVQLIIPSLYRMLINGINDGFVDLGGIQTEFNIDFLLTKICMPMIGIVFLMVIGRFLWRVCFFGTALRVEADMRLRMFAVCRTLSQRFYQENKVGNLMSLFTNDLDTINECFGSGILTFCDAIFLSVLAITDMAKMNVLLTVLSMIPMMLLLASGLIISKYITEKWKIRQEAYSSISDMAQESFSGIAVIKAFVKEGKELIAFRKLNKDNENANVAYARLSVTLTVCVTLFVESVTGIILGYGGYLVHKGVFSAGQLVEFIGYFGAIVWPVNAVSELIEIRARGKASLKRISDLLDEKPDVIDGCGVTDTPALSGAIKFNDLTFYYPSRSEPVLSHIDLDIKAGERVGIIGPTGSGKTTLVDLILRTYNVPKNSILLDGKDINDIPIHTVRENAAYVPQDNFLFSDTIENNIRFAFDSGDESEIEKAAKLSDVHDNISEFTNGYSTVLGECGTTVSGGQKQRISIARALMKNAPILILDDSVSAVDVGTEKIILENLKETREGKTTIFIAHRVTTVENMDKIVYLEDGKILGVGTHEELIESCKEYKRMVDLQRLDEKAEANS